MVNKVEIDYCKVGKGRLFFGRLNGLEVEVHSMSCLGKDRCVSCRNQFCADVTYKDRTMQVEERTAMEFVREVKRITKVDLTNYLKGSPLRKY